MTNQTKYIHIRHLDYWWGVYNIGKFKSKDVSAVEFSLSNDPAGEGFYFHFDFYTLPALENMMSENEFIEADSSDYPCFLEKCRELQNGELDYFVGALYYEDYHPMIKDCELGEGSLFDKKSPSISPYYAMVFLGENKPLLPELLAKWLELLSTGFFADSFDFVLANVPSKEDAENEYKNEQGSRKLSHLIYIASDIPLREVKNPHYKTLSVNEALSMGLEVDEVFLRPGYNRNEPDVILWSDAEIIIDTEAGTVDDGDFDDDFAILGLSDATDDVYTEKKHRAYIEWSCTAGRAQRVIDYIREQLAHTAEIELWNIWMGNEDRPRIRKRTIPIDKLTPDDVIELEAMDVLSEPPTQYCFVITR